MYFVLLFLSAALHCCLQLGINVRIPCRRGVVLSLRGLDVVMLTLVVQPGVGDLVLPGVLQPELSLTDLLLYLSRVMLSLVESEQPPSFFKDISLLLFRALPGLPLLQYLSVQ